jgi:hypothetical protein
MFSYAALLFDSSGCVHCACVLLGSMMSERRRAEAIWMARSFEWILLKSNFGRKRFCGWP